MDLTAVRDKLDELIDTDNTTRGIESGHLMTTAVNLEPEEALSVLRARRARIENELRALGLVRASLEPVPPSLRQFRDASDRRPAPTNPVLAAIQE